MASVKGRLCKIIKRYGIWMVLYVSGIWFITDRFAVLSFPREYFKPMFLFGAALLFSVFVWTAFRWGTELHKLFLAAYLALGICYFIAVPLFKVPDEPSHFLRAYEISMGHMVSDRDENGDGGRSLPYNLTLMLLSVDPVKSTHYDIWARNGDTRLSKDEVFFVFWNTSLYAPVSYLPQVIGIALLRLLTDRIVWIAYGGRIANFLAIMLVGFFSVKYTPVGKKVMMMVMLLPMSMQESVSMAPDAMVTALTCALAAFVLYMRYEHEGAMGKRHYVLLYLLCIFIGLYKIVYLPFCLLPFLIPPERFGGRKYFILHAVCLGFFVCITSLGWLWVAGTYLSKSRGSDGDAQIAFILSEPLEYLKILWRTLRTEGGKYLENLVGRYFGWLDLPVAQWMPASYGMLSLGAVFLEREAGRERCRWIPALYVSAGFSVFLLIFTSIYVQWDLPRAELIEGIQGRYFVPVIPLVYLAVYSLIPGFSRSRVTMAHFMTALFAIHLCICGNLSQWALGYLGSRWIQDENGSRYQLSDWEYVEEAWYELEDKWYYFDQEGYAVKGSWVEYKEDWYYLKDDGSMLTDGTAPDGKRVDGQGKRID